jgi:hypothetical protein
MAKKYKKTRAKKNDGTFASDDKSTPSVNEAFVTPRAKVNVTGGPVADGVRQIGQRRLGGKLVDR